MKKVTAKKADNKKAAAAKKQATSKPVKKTKSSSPKSKAAAKTKRKASEKREDDSVSAVKIGYDDEDEFERDEEKFFKEREEKDDYDEDSEAGYESVEEDFEDVADDIADAISEKGPYEKTNRERIFDLMHIHARIRIERTNILHEKYNILIDKELYEAIDEINSIIEKDGDPDTYVFKPSYFPMLKKKSIRGINGLEVFMMSIYNENKFCRGYEDDDIAGVYARYITSNDGYDADINIFHLVYISALISELANDGKSGLMVSRDDCAKVEEDLSSFSDDEKREKILDKAMRLSGGNPDYNEAVFSNLLPEIIDNVKHNLLATFLGINE